MFAALAVCSTRNRRILYVCSQFWAEQTAAFKTRPFGANDRNELCVEYIFSFVEHTCCEVFYLKHEVTALISVLLCRRFRFSELLFFLG